MKHLLATCLMLSALCPGITSRAALSPLLRPPNFIVFYTDDHGHADLGIHGAVADVRTPNIDALARSGVIARHGYTTAPQCVPSRAGLMTGRFQGRFNLDTNQSALDGFNQQTTIAKRLQAAGYATAQFGKWHLGPTPEIPSHGFKHSFAQHGQQAFPANITLDGKDRPMGNLPPEMYHVDGCSRAAAAVIERYQDQPFFLYIAYRAPHTPLDAPAKYTARFPGEMPERRRQALAMLSAVDDGVGLVLATLKKHGLSERTLIFLVGDNGAPLKIHKTDSPLDGDAGGWDGSLNTPLNGEKGMLSEGGMHTPFVIAWPGTIPGGQVYEHPVSTLDFAATAVAQAKLTVKSGELDGVNLVPYLTGKDKSPPHDALMWRWAAQSAIREGNWKLLRGGDREYLYNLGTDLSEKNNLAAQHPEIAKRLRDRLTSWTAELDPPGLALGRMAPAWNEYFDFYLEGKAVPKPEAKPATTTAASAPVQGWLARNGTLTAKNGILELTPEKGNKGRGAFITRNQLKVASPVLARLTLKTATAGEASIAWRLEDETDFLATNRATFQISASREWQTHEIKLPAVGKVVHVRVHVPGGRDPVQFREVEFTTAGK